jgi:uncharacterized membrane protein
LTVVLLVFVVVLLLFAWIRVLIISNGYPTVYLLSYFVEKEEPKNKEGEKQRKIERERERERVVGMSDF